MKTFYSYNEQIMKDEDLFIHHHLGLGDHIVLNGLIRYISEKQNKTIFLLCKQHNFSNVSLMFSDLKNLEVVSAKNLNEFEAAKLFLQNKTNINFLKIGHESYNPILEKKNNWDCGQVFYHLAKIPYEIRYNGFKFHFNEDRANMICTELNLDEKPFIFVHDDEARGFKIEVKTDKTIIKNNINVNIFDYVKLLEKADEIHLMASSFYCFVESLDNLKAKMFFHDIRGAKLGSEQKYNWNNINYEKI